MIRALRTALANWIVPKPRPLNNVSEAFFREIYSWRDDAIVGAVKTFPGGLTVIDKNMIESAGPRSYNYWSPVTRTRPGEDA